MDGDFDGRLLRDDHHFLDGRVLRKARGRRLAQVFPFVRDGRAYLEKFEELVFKDESTHQEVLVCRLLQEIQPPPMVPHALEVLPGNEYNQGVHERIETVRELLDGRGSRPLLSYS